MRAFLKVLVKPLFNLSTKPVQNHPDFDPKQKAFYYVRVLEIPKPSWQAYDAKYYKVKMPKEVPMTVQDRAYTSPIWFTP